MIKSDSLTGCFVKYTTMQTHFLLELFDHFKTAFIRDRIRLEPVRDWYG